MSHEVVASYSFFSYFRRGLGREIAATDPMGAGLPLRATLDVKLEINSDPNLSGGAKVELLGPGDITGFDRAAIVRTDPVDGAVDFEPNYFPSIELDPPDLPWRYSPAGPSAEKIRPWLTLIVLDESEHERPRSTGPLPIVRVKDQSLLPPPDQIWAWAHAQLSDKVVAPSDQDLSKRLKNGPDQLISRLLCPRRLHPHRTYHAFLVPSFEAGRLAGLAGDPGTDGSKPAWGATSGAIDLPIYHHWSFRTSAGGDFESLVRRLEARVIDPRVGTREVTVGKQVYSVPAVPPELLLEGALRAVGGRRSTWPNPAPFRDRLGIVLNAPADLEDNGAAAVEAVAPPMYGRWPGNARRVADGGQWLGELNLDPRNRAAAGLGTRVVRERQEELMAEAWRQVGAIELANAEVSKAKMARLVGRKVWKKNFASLKDDQLLQLTRPMHQRALGSPTTIAAQIFSSPMPAAALSASFRRLSRPTAVLSRKMGSLQKESLLGRLNEKLLAAAGPAKTPAGTPLFLDVAERLAPPGLSPSLRNRLPQLPALAIYAMFALLLVALISAAIVPILAALVAAAGVAAGVLGIYLRGPAERWAVARPFTPEARAPEQLAALPPRPNFVVSAPGTPPAAATARSGPDSIDAAQFRRVMINFESRYAAQPEPPAPKSLDLQRLRSTLLSTIDPKNSVPKRVAARLDLDLSRFSAGQDPIAPIMKAPEFLDPMYEPLRDLSPDYLLPGLQWVPNDTIGLLQTNQSFVEAYMVGLSHEMARELLWREYPTDMKGTYFQQFWDVRGSTKPLRDIEPIHHWRKLEKLGDHKPSGASANEPLVLLIRGELLKKYPTASIFAVKAVWDPVARRRDFDQQKGLKLPLFRGTLPPDVTFIGFDLEPAQVKGSNDPNADQGWFFVIQEQPSEPRFGLDESTGPANTPPGNWSELSWGHLAADRNGFDTLLYVDVRPPPRAPWPVDGTGTPPLRWGKTAAETAAIHLQQPVRVAVHGSRMLPG